LSFSILMIFSSTVIRILYNSRFKVNGVRYKVAVDQDLMKSYHFTCNVACCQLAETFFNHKGTKDTKRGYFFDTDCTDKYESVQSVKSVSDESIQ
jgi:hypothetical protein